MSEETVAMACENCDLHVVKLYNVSKRKLCSYCKADPTRTKVKHDYASAEKYVNELHKNKT